MNYYNDMLACVQKAITFDCVQQPPQNDMPFGENINNCLEYTLDVAKNLGFTIVNKKYYGYAEIGSGELFGILGHLDTVPFNNSGWKFPALSAIIDNGILYGRGVLDNKGPIIACLFAVKELSLTYLPTKKIRIIFGCNEESGWKCMDKYVENEEMPAVGFSPDGDFPVINCEKGIVYFDVEIEKPNNLINICGGERPNVVMSEATATLSAITEQEKTELLALGGSINGNKVTFFGKSAHGSCPHLGINAFYKMLSAFSQVFGDGYTFLLQKLATNDGSGLNVNLQDAKSGATTCNVGLVSLQNNKLHFSLDIRYPISYTKELVQNRIQGALPDAKLQITMFHNPLYIAPDDALCTKLLTAYNNVMQTNAKPISIGGGTYARVLPKGVAFGPIFPNTESTIHQANECVKLTDFEKMYKIYLEAIKNLCFSPTKAKP